MKKMMKKMIENFRLWLRSWLEVGPEVSIEMYSDFVRSVEQWRNEFRLILDRLDTDCQNGAGDIRQHAEKLELMQVALDRLALKAVSLEETLFSSVQGLQDQISDMNLSSSVPVKVVDEPVEMMSGHVPFSVRKQNYEKSKRAPLQTPTGKQIEDNARLVASGTRKTDTSA